MSLFFIHSAPLPVILSPVSTLKCFLGDRNAPNGLSPTLCSFGAVDRYHETKGVAQGIVAKGIWACFCAPWGVEAPWVCGCRLNGQLPPCVRTIEWTDGDSGMVILHHPRMSDAPLARQTAHMHRGAL